MQEKLLPHYYKKIAIPIVLICISGLVFTDPLSAWMQVNENLVEWIIKDLLLISLIVVVLSKEKVESLGIHKIRIRELLNAGGFGAVVVIYDSVSNLFYQSSIEDIKSGYELMLLMLFYYLFFFFIKKNTKPARA